MIIVMMTMIITIMMMMIIINKIIIIMIMMMIKPKILEMLELCMSGQVFRIFRRSSFAQIMKAFIGRWKFVDDLQHVKVNFLPVANLDMRSPVSLPFWLADDFCPVFAWTEIIMIMIVIMVMVMVMMVKIVTMMMMMMIKTHLLLLPFQASAHTWTQAAPGNCNQILIFLLKLVFHSHSYFMHTLLIIKGSYSYSQ